MALKGLATKWEMWEKAHGTENELKSVAFNGQPKVMIDSKIQTVNNNFKLSNAIW